MCECLCWRPVVSYCETVLKHPRITLYVISLLTTRAFSWMSLLVNCPFTFRSLFMVNANVGKHNIIYHQQFRIFAKMLCLWWACVYYVPFVCLNTVTVNCIAFCYTASPMWQIPQRIIGHEFSKIHKCLLPEGGFVYD